MQSNVINGYNFNYGYPNIPPTTLPPIPPNKRTGEVLQSYPNKKARVEADNIQVGVPVNNVPRPEVPVINVLMHMVSMDKFQKYITVRNVFFNDIDLFGQRLCNKTILAYCENAIHARDVCAILNIDSPPNAPLAKCITSTMDQESLNQLMRDHRDKKIRVVVVDKSFLSAYNNPNIEAMFVIDPVMEQDEMQRIAYKVQEQVNGKTPLLWYDWTHPNMHQYTLTDLRIIAQPIQPPLQQNFFVTNSWPIDTTSTNNTSTINISALPTITPAINKDEPKLITIKMDTSTPVVKPADKPPVRKPIKTDTSTPLDKPAAKPRESIKKKRAAKVIPPKKKAQKMVVVEFTKEAAQTTFPKIMQNWQEKVNFLCSHMDEYDSEDVGIIQSSRYIIAELIKKLEKPPAKSKFFATVDSKTMAVYAFAIAKIETDKSEGDITFIATDPSNLRLKDRLTKRVKGAASEIINTVSSQVSSLYVYALKPAKEFYLKQGFKDVSLHDNELILCLENTELS